MDKIVSSVGDGTTDRMPQMLMDILSVPVGTEASSLKTLRTYPKIISANQDGTECPN